MTSAPWPDCAVSYCSVPLLQVAEFVDERPEEVKQMEAFRSSAKWKLLGDHSGDGHFHHDEHDPSATSVLLWRKRGTVLEAQLSQQETITNGV